MTHQFFSIMKNWIFNFLLSCILFPVIFSCNNEKKSVWQPVKGVLSTKWAAEISPVNAWPEYPRPQLLRDEWINLNGLWDYAIAGKDSMPTAFRGKILVPFPVESALSGVMKKVGTKNRVWYKREINIPAKWKNKRVLLHFEAVDWQAKVMIDSNEIGQHEGGYDPFTFDITNYVQDGK